MTLKEVQLVVKAFMEHQESKQKQIQVEVYNTAYLTSIFVGCILGGKQLPTYNDVFKEGIQEIQVEDPAKELIEASILADKMRDFARNANEQRKQ